MGITISRQSCSEERLAYNVRKQNCKIIKRLYAIIEDAYKNNFLTEYEYYATIGWYYGMKNRHLTAEEEIFVIALDKINDLVCSTIQERYNDQIRANGEDTPLMPPECQTIRNLTDTDVLRFRRIVEHSPYNRNRK